MPSEDDDVFVKAREILYGLLCEARLPHINAVLNQLFVFTDGENALAGTIFGLEATNGGDLIITVSNKYFSGCKLCYLVFSGSTCHAKVTIDTGIGTPTTELLPGYFYLLPA